MADSQQTTKDNRIRKLRKKLRQIENLQRSSGARELTEEENAKVLQRDEIREQLQELISMVLEEEEEEEMETQVITNDENPSATNAEEDDIVAQEKKQAQEEVLQAEPVVTNEEKDNQKTEDANMATETDEVIQTQDTGSATEAMPEEGDIQQVIDNETDDIKVQKISKKKGSKRKNVETGFKEWKDMNFSVKVIEGHHHPVCAVDFNRDTIISGGHDTSFKIWDAKNCEELFSLGGHTGSISAALLLSEDRAVTGSQDCSIRFWDIKTGSCLSSVYVFNPVTCLALNDRQLAIGNEGGKIDIYDLDKETIMISSKAHDESLISVVFMDDGKLASASADGIVKVSEVKDNELVAVMDSYDDITAVTAFAGDVNPHDTPNTSLMNLPLRRINCMATFKDSVFWGDDGYNIKAFDVNTGQILKLRNNLTEYSPTDSLTVLRDEEEGYLLSAGFDIDSGNGYINVRKLPSMEYLGTISDGSLGHVSTLSAALNDGKIEIVTGGSELRVWQQLMPRNGKKRPASDEMEDVIPCKFICSYNKACNSEEESDSETENEEDTAEDLPEKKEVEKTSWCVLQ